ncbi:MAG: hypothetical protein U1G07_09625 [Verrucomicrobiota bacterium]
MKTLQAKARVEGLASNKPRSARQFPWTKEEDAWLGKLTDREEAEKLNRALGAVRDRRRFLGKAAVGHAPQPFGMEREPRDRYARLFATKPNQELCTILGWSYKRIHMRRRQLAGGKVRKLQPEWTLEEDRLLGTKPDQMLARKFGRTIVAVEARRIQLNRPKPDAAFKVVKVIASGSRRKQSANTVKAKPGAAYCTWMAEEDALLGKFTDEEVARRTGHSLTSVRQRGRNATF